MPRKDKRGWIKLHRSIQDSAIWNIDDSFSRRSAWIDLLLMVNHEDRTIIVNGKKQVIEAGQRWTSVRTLANRWQWTRDRVMRYLKLLESLDMITLDRTPNGTLLTVVNYGFYQDGRDTTKDTYKDTNKDTDKDTGKDTDKDETRTIKNYKKNEEEKNGSAVDSSWGERE